MSDIASWLGKLGLDKYVEAFTLNEVDCDALRHLAKHPTSLHACRR
ncbi:SAM domain-containing protein [Phyllobacterium zundukense]|uniref:SAM domain-containing protein n=1 Tax=Phyllobacterium zundukense TaxID=1867719 RepID=A0ACD4D053_9HYPH|nr:SAM domain-containing protein [Phyllobacterium zundukense]UXN59073.1 SAM domain-containing protein [Phyllobacterium zundukense]